MNIKRSIICIILLFCSALFAQENNEIQQDIRIAVIDVGSKEAPDSFSQFLWINIAEQPNIVLVEREQINKILKEQALNLQFGDDSDTEHFVKAGEILGAEYLLMYESGDSAQGQGQVPVRFRLVETRYGMKFWDYALLLDKEEINHQKQAKEISETVSSKFQIKNKYGNFTYVAIGAFRSEELSQNWNWISDELAAGIEQKLVNQPSIVLLERRRTRPLMNERDLVEGLPETLRSSAVFIDGSYRMDRQKNDKSISVTFYGYSNNQKIFTINIEGSSVNIRELSQKAFIAITEELNLKHEIISMDPAKEAALLIKQAKSFEAFKDYPRAVMLYEATLAIDPYSTTAIQGLIRIGNLFPGGDIVYKRQLISLYLNNIKTLKHLAEHYLEIKEKQESKLHPMESYRSVFLNARYAFRYLYNIYPYIANDKDNAPDIINTFQTHLSDLFQTYLNLLKKEDKEDELLYSSLVQEWIYSSYWWTSSPQEYFDNVYDWLELAVNGNPNVWDININGHFFGFNKCPLWKDRKDNIDIYLTFLNNLSKHEHPLIRACAYEAFTEYYIKYDKEKVSKYYETFINTIVNEVIPNFPEWGHIKTTWNPNLHDNVVNIVGQKCVAESQARITYQVLRYSKKFHMGIWRDRILSCYEDLEKADETQKAISLLSACKEKLQKEYPNDKDDIETINSWMRVLKRKHPELTIDIELVPTQDWNPLTLFDMKDISNILKKYNPPQPSTNFLRRLLIDEHSAALIFIWGVLPYNGHIMCGIIRLNPDTFTFQELQMYEGNITTSTDNIQTLYQKGPVSTIYKNTIYVYFSNYGIIIFPEKGKPYLLIDEKSLPTEMISSMDIMNGRLYASTGHNRLTGLIEIKLDNFQTKTLISPRERADSHPLDGSEILQVIANRWKNVLWLSVEPKDLPSNIDEIYYFKPDTLEFNHMTEVTIFPNYFNRLLRQGYSLYFSTDNNLYTVNLLTNKINLVVNHSILESPVKTATFWQTNSKLGMFAGDNKTLISTARDEGGEYSIVIFKAGESKPRQVTGDSLPSYYDIKEFGYTEKGFLILTNNALYLLPHEEIKNIKQEEQLEK